MKTNPALLRKASLFLLTISYLLISNASRAQVIVSGGSGSAVTLQVTAPISFTMNSNYTEPFFHVSFNSIFTEAPVSSFESFWTGDITVTGTGFAATNPQTIIFGINHSANWDILDLDLSWSSSPSVTAGTVVTLNPGTVVTNMVTGSSLPVQSSSFTAYIIHSNGTILSNAVSVTSSAVPEPSTYAVMVGVAVFGVVALNRRTQKAAA